MFQDVFFLFLVDLEVSYLLILFLPIFQKASGSYVIKQS